MQKEATEKPPYFYKYVTAKAAMATLLTNKLRFSSPKRFNDPFDIQFDFKIPFSKKEFLDAVRQKFKDIEVSGHAVPLNIKTEQQQAFHECISMILMHSLKSKRDELFENLVENIDAKHNHLWANLPEHNSELRQNVEYICCFCISELKNNLLMWAHYADDHQGAVIKLNCFPEGITSLCRLASKVRYTKDFPSCFTLAELVDGVFDVASINFDDHFYYSAWTKSTDWKYEREWRLINKLDNPEDQNNGYKHILIPPEEVAEIIFGCRMLDEDRKNLASLIMSKYPHAKIKVAVKDPMMFKLNYEKLEARHLASNGGWNAYSIRFLQAHHIL